MDRALASQLVKTALGFAPQINESIRALMITGPSGQQLHEYRRAAGRVLGYLYTDILRVIFAEYPDLEPESIKNGEAEEEPRIDRAVAETIVRLMSDVELWLKQLPENGQSAFRDGIDEMRNGIRDVQSFVAKSYPEMVPRPDRQ